MRFLLYNIRYAAGIGRHFHFPVPYSGYFKNTNGNLKKIGKPGYHRTDRGRQRFFSLREKQPGRGHRLGTAARSYLSVKISRIIHGPQSTPAEQTGQCDADQPGDCFPEVSLFSRRCQTAGN